MCRRSRRRCCCCCTSACHNLNPAGPILDMVEQSRPAGGVQQSAAPGQSPLGRPAPVTERGRQQRRTALQLARAASAPRGTSSGGDPPPELLEGIADDRSGIGDGLLEQQCREQFLQAVDRLSAADQLLLERIFLRGEVKQDVARSMGRSPGGFPRSWVRSKSDWLSYWGRILTTSAAILIFAAMPSAAGAGRWSPRARPARKAPVRPRPRTGGRPRIWRRRFRSCCAAAVGLGAQEPSARAAIRPSKPSGTS